MSEYTRASAGGGTTISSGTLADRPSAGVAGRYYYATDIYLLFYDNGTSWDIIGVIQSGTLANIPVAMIANRYYLATDIPALYRDNGVSWDLVGGLASATVIQDRHIWVLDCGDSWNGFGTGGTGLYGMFGHISTGVVAGNARIASITWEDNIIGDAVSGVVYDLNPEFEVCILLDVIEDNDVWVVALPDRATAPPANNEKQFGFHISNSRVYARTGDGTNASELDLGVDVAALEWFRLRAKLISGIRQESYVDGAQQANKTTNLPTGTVDTGTWAGFVYAIRTNENVGHHLYFKETRIIYDFGL